MDHLDNLVLISLIFTGRNEVVTKVMFLLVSVILSTGRESASVHAGIPPPPPRRHPPAKETPPGSRSPAYGQ